MPREEQIPPSKEGRLSVEITGETANFNDYIEGVVFATLNDTQKIDLLIDFVNKNNAISNLIIEDLKERIELLENS